MYTNNFTSATTADFSLTDYCTDIPYTIHVSDANVSIRSENFNADVSIDNPIISVCVHANTFFFLTYTEFCGDYNAAFYIYDKINGTLKFNLTSLPVFTDETKFTVDNKNRFYLVDRYDNNAINCYHEGEISSFKLNAAITQIICLDGEHITAITTNGVYLIKDLKSTQISDASPVAPCVYTADGFVTDSINTKFIYEKGVLIPFIPEVTNTEAAEKPLDNLVITENYIITAQHTTVAKLYKALGLNRENLTVYKKDGSTYAQGKLGTGIKAMFEGKTYSIIIYGELTGEGNINSRDLKLMMKFLTEEEVPDSVQIISADINEDGNINTKDLLALSKLY